jgi:hypothetical protein
VSTAAQELRATDHANASIGDRKIKSTVPVYEPVITAIKKLQFYVVNGATKEKPQTIDV